jgi:hypothetical protein
MATMAQHNLVVAYDLIQPGQNYEAIRKRIKELGKYHQFQYSAFYVNTSLTSAEAYDYVAAAMDANDKLLVAEAFNVVSSSPQSVADAINRVWFSNAA